MRAAQCKVNARGSRQSCAKSSLRLGGCSRCSTAPVFQPFCTMSEFFRSLFCKMCSASPKMDFSQMPDDSLLKVILDFSLVERIRLGRVNTQFYRMSQFAISKTKEIDLTTESCRRMTPDALREIFSLCHRHLEKINLASVSAQVRVVDVFAEFTFPRLLELRIDFGPDHGNDLFDEIMANHPKIKKLMWEASFDPGKCGDYPMAPYFAPTFVPMENLTSLKIICCNASMLRKFIVCGPNLKQFSVYLCDDRGIQNALEEFFARFSKLEECNIRYFEKSRFDFMRSESFRRLKELKKLRISRPRSPVDPQSGQFLLRIATTFAKLKLLVVDGIDALEGNDVVLEIRSWKVFDIIVNNSTTDVLED